MKNLAGRIILALAAIMILGQPSAPAAESPVIARPFPTWMTVTAAAVGSLSAAEIPARDEGGWQAGNTSEMPRLKVSLSKPVLVARSKGYLWFPTVVRRRTGELVAMMSDYADEHVAQGTSRDTWLADGVSTSRYQITDIRTSLRLSTFCHENGHMICGRAAWR